MVGKKSAVNVSHVAILSSGEMGAAIGAVLAAGGLETLTCLSGRSELSRLRASEAGFRLVESYDQLVSEADLLLSVVPPGRALDVAKAVAEGMRRSGARPPYADCNAVSPQTAQAIGAVLSDAGASFIDAAIVGPPPRTGGSGTRIYCSGPDTGALEALNAFGLDVRPLGPLIGQASGLKMVYAASSKGTTALWTELLVAARALGLDDALRREFAEGRGEIGKQIMSQIPSMPRRSRRWVAEMEEIAATFEAVGLTPLMLQGAADMYRLVGETPLAEQNERQAAPSLETVVETLAEHATRRKKAQHKG